jgi:hypothetical protein
VEEQIERNSEILKKKKIREIETPKGEKKKNPGSFSLFGDRNFSILLC